VSISGVSSNPLLALTALTKSGGSAAASVFAPASSAKSSAPVTILPAASAIQLSPETLLALQGETKQLAAPASLEQTEAPTPEQLFLDEAHKSPMQRMREQVLGALGLTEESLAQMPPEQRRAAEDQIRQLIEEKIKQAWRTDQSAPQSDTDAMLQAAL
jgi:hypothetical protein